MKIAILTSGILPVPAVQGGAVENLVDFYLEYNDHHKLHDITVYSVWHPDVKKHPALESEVNHYKYIKLTGWWARLKRKIYQRTHSNEYYNHHIEYFFEEAYNNLKKNKYDMIILENRPGYAYKLAARGHNCIVLHLHNDLLNQGSKHASQILDSIKKILTVSDYIKKRVQTIKVDNKIQTVHNGIDIEKFSCQSSNSISRQSYGFSADDFMILFSGRINKDKGISELIDAMLLLKEYPHIKLLVLGSTFFGNATNEDTFVQMLKEKTRELTDRIVFTGFIPYAEIPHYLSLANIAAIPSVWDDPFPTTVLEAQAMGLPIITTKRGGIPEELTEDNAILLDTDEHFVDNLASAILELYQHPEKRKQMSEASLQRSRLFNKETYASNFLKAIQDEQ
jgi:glycosyltransferase involved in cell wall biosynthesis